MNTTRTIAAMAVIATLTSAGTAGADHLLTGKDVKNGTITGVDLKDRSVGTADLRDGTVKSEDLGRGAVARDALVDGVVDTTAIDPATAEQLGAVDARTRAETSAATEPGQLADLTVTCPAQQVATGGGGRLERTPTSGVIVVSEPIVDAAGKPAAWHVAVRNNSPDPDTATAFAVCAP